MTNERAVEILNLDLDILGQYGGETAEAYKMAIQALEAQPNSNEFFNFDAPMVKKSEAVSREQVIEEIEFYQFNPQHFTYESLIDDIKNLPPVTPQYTDEEIDKAQAVEQAYVDKMVELAVKEIKERYSDAIGKMKKAIDEMTEIHSDGEFYIKNVDAKWIISKYLCGAEMSGGEEDGKDSACG